MGGGGGGVAMRSKGRDTSPPPRFYVFVLLFASHRSALSERLEQAKLVYRSEHDLEYSLTTIQPILSSQESPVLYFFAIN